MQEPTTSSNQDSLHSIQDWLTYPLLSWEEFTLMPINILGSVFVFVFAILFSKVLQRTLTNVLSKRSKISPDRIFTFNRIIHYIIVFIGFIFALSLLGVSFNRMALIFGALGVGIGFGLQNIVNNFFSGVIVLFERSLKVGDFVELESGVFGEVKDIKIRSTLVRTTDNIDIIVPNSEFISGRVTNWTLAERFRRFRIPFSVAYGSDKNLVRKAVIEEAMTVRHTMKISGFEPQVWMTGFGDSALNFTLGVWVEAESVRRPAPMTSDYLWAIDDALRKYNIEIPFPQRDLHLRSISASAQAELKLKPEALNPE